MTLSAHPYRRTMARYRFYSLHAILFLFAHATRRIAACPTDFMLDFFPRCAGRTAHWIKWEATMSKMKGIAFFASVAAVSLGSTPGQAQQPPPQSPNMTFFVTSTGPGQGARPRGLAGAGPNRQ